MKSFSLILMMTLAFSIAALNALAYENGYRKPASQSDAALFDKIDSECAGNDNGRTGKYDVKKFSAAAAMKKLKSQDKGCKNQIHSSNREEAVSEFRKIFHDSSDFGSCVNKLGLGAESLRIVEDPTNLAVFSSVHGGDDDDRESCDFWHVHIYRADGTLIEFVHDETD